MAKPDLQLIDVNTATFQTWLNYTNSIIDILKSDVITASPLGDATIGNATLIGSFTANTTIVEDQLKVGLISGKTIGDPILISEPMTFNSTNLNVATFLNNDGARTKYSTSTVEWTIGLETSAANAFIITTGAGDPKFKVTSTGDVTVPGSIQIDANATISGNLTVTGTLSASGSISGNATTATTLQTSRTIGMTGDVTWTSASFNGSGNVTGSSTISNNVISNEKIRQSTGLSLIGRSASSTGNVADITAGSDHQVLRCSGSSIGFGSINLASTAAVTGTLALANGGTGATTEAGVRSALSVPINTITFSAGTGLTGGGNLTANRSFALTGQALTLHNFSSTGIMVRNGSGAFLGRKLVGADDQINISNEDGTSGNPTISVIIASLGESTDGSNNLKLMTPLRVKQAIASQVPTLVSDQIASSAVGSVGSYAFLRDTVSRVTSAGTTRSGSDLRYSGVYSVSSAGSYAQYRASGTPAGTWVACGYSYGLDSGDSTYGATLWKRIS